MFKTNATLVAASLLVLASAVTAQPLPPGAEAAKAALDRSPRHGEYVDVMAPGWEKPVKTWVVYPETKEKAGVVIVIHEIFGLTDWVRAVADQLAADGFIALAPDLLSGRAPGGGGTEAAGDQARDLIRALKPEDVTSALQSVRAYGEQLDASNGKTASIGFCWGGAESFRFAAEKGVLGAVVYYGTTPDEDVLARITVPVAGHYGEDDARVNATLPRAEQALGDRFGKHVYPGAGHGFLRQQDGRDGANRKASEQAWPETIRFLNELLK